LGLAIAALVAAPVTMAKPLTAGSRAEPSADSSATTAASSGVSWDDLLAGLVLGAVVVVLALRAAKVAPRRSALRRSTVG
jgi:hypothetical protein